MKTKEMLNFSNLFDKVLYMSDRTMTLGSTQPITEMSSRSIFWG